MFVVLPNYATLASPCIDETVTSSSSVLDWIGCRSPAKRCRLPHFTQPSTIGLYGDSATFQAHWRDFYTTNRRSLRLFARNLGVPGIPQIPDSRIHYRRSGHTQVIAQATLQRRI